MLACANKKILHRLGEGYTAFVYLHLPESSVGIGTVHISVVAVASSGQSLSYS